jgi:hypothetical protein
MPKRNPAEFFLALAVGPTRAAAISGDLLELAANRSRLWYYTLYLRTLFALTWRTPAAFLIACAAFTALYQLNVHFLNPWGSAHRGISNIPHAYIIRSLTFINYQLWFLAPFAAFKYGLRDRITRFTLAAALVGMCAYYFIALPNFPLAFTVLALCTLTGLLLSARRRSAVIAVTTTTVVGAIVLLNLHFLAHLYTWIDEHKPLNHTSHFVFFETGYAFPHTLFWIVTWTIAVLNMLALAFVYARLHRLLSRPATHRKQIA